MLSSGSSETREKLLGDLVLDVRQSNGLGASFFRVAAGQIGLNVTDLQVIDILDTMGPMPAGRLAELTGLTTGAITGMLDRLEKDGFVSRESDPEDGRRKIIHLAPSEDAANKIAPIFEAVVKQWTQLAADYDDEGLAIVLDFLKRGNAMAREEIARLRETPAQSDKDFSALLGDVTTGRLIFPYGTAQLTLRADAGMADLYQARFDGGPPEVKVHEGIVTVRYPRRNFLLSWGERAAHVTLNAAIPWRITLQGGASEVNADLSGLDLLDLDVKGGMSNFRITLPNPSSVIPIRIAGGASDITIRRPEGVAMRVHLKGWVSTLIFDDQTYGNVGSDVRLQSPGYEGSAKRYDVEVVGSASTVTVVTE